MLPQSLMYSAAAEWWAESAALWQPASTFGRPARSATGVCIGVTAGGSRVSVCCPVVSICVWRGEEGERKEERKEGGGEEKRGGGRRREERGREMRMEDKGREGKERRRRGVRGNRRRGRREGREREELGTRKERKMEKEEEG